MEKFSSLEKVKMKRIVEKLEFGDTDKDGMVKVGEIEISVEVPSEESTTDVTDSDPVKFFSKLFESREMAHMFHLKAQGGESSYATHMALGSYYEDILDKIDDIVEVYQGQYDIIEGYDVIDKESGSSEDPTQYFIELAEFVKRTRYSALLEEDAHLQAIVDEILIIMYKLIYKLRFLK
jgi:hypothetical protein